METRIVGLTPVDGSYETAEKMVKRMAQAIANDRADSEAGPFQEQQYLYDAIAAFTALREVMNEEQLVFYCP